MNHMDADRAYKEKARLELQKNDRTHFQQILEAISLKAAAVWSPISHL